jgi:hypothetical protein
MKEMSPLIREALTGVDELFEQLSPRSYMFRKKFRMEHIKALENLSSVNLILKASYYPKFFQGLIRNRVIPLDTEIEREYNEERYIAKILPDGRFCITRKRKEYFFDNVHSAAAFITKRETNGMEWWRIRSPLDFGVVRLSVFLK